MDSDKSITLFEMKKDRFPDYIFNNYFFDLFVNNFSSLLLCKINFLDSFDMGD